MQAKSKTTEMKISNLKYYLELINWAVYILF